MEESSAFKILISTIGLSLANVAKAELPFGNKAELFPQLISPAFKDGQLFSVSCNKGKFCVAVGAYTDTKDLLRPLMAVSKDGGNTWAIQSGISKPTLTPALAQGN